MVHVKSMAEHKSRNSVASLLFRWIAVDPLFQYTHAPLSENEQKSPSLPTIPFYATACHLRILHGYR